MAWLYNLQEVCIGVEVCVEVSRRCGVEVWSVLEALLVLTMRACCVRARVREHYLTFVRSLLAIKDSRKGFRVEDCIRVEIPIEVISSRVTQR